MDTLDCYEKKKREKICKTAAEGPEAGDEEEAGKVRQDVGLRYQVPHH